MKKFKKLIFNWKVILALIFIAMALIAISPNPYAEGVSIRTVEKDSAADLAGIENPIPTSTPVSRERIIEIDGEPIKNEQDYFLVTQNLEVNDTLFIKTNQNDYLLTVKPITQTKTLNETETVNKTIQEFDEETNTTINKTIQEEVSITTTEVIGVEDIGLKVYNSPTTNIKKGLDLQGGTRVILKPDIKLSDENTDFLIDSLQQRLNVYGLSDVIIRAANDLSGNSYVLIEIAGANEEEVNNLLGKQGVFEAKIANSTVFEGGEKDIRYVCSSAECSGIDPNTGCGQTQDGSYACRFRFSISVSEEAAQRQSDLTNTLEVIDDQTGDGYLSEQLLLFLDGEQVDELNIGADLKGRVVQDISITGSGAGATQEEAVEDALKNMKRLQTILKTGSLPVKLTIEKSDNISPALGKEFISNALMIALFAIIAVVVIVTIRYRSPTIAISMALTLIVELVLLLGFAAFMRWNIDLAAIAGILIVVGTGVDHLIIITDEVMRGHSEQRYQSWKSKIKSAFFIIFGAFLTTLLAMGPLVFAGAGLLRGFAITTIMGLFLGVFIARPAFAAAIEILMIDSQ